MSSSLAQTKLIALIVASSFFMQNLDGAIINTSLPQMAQSFGVQTLDLSIGITIYMMSAAAFVPLSGWLADRFGSKKIFMLAVLVFTLASLACGLAENLLVFSMARAVQGLGGALMTPVGRIVVLRHTEKSNLVEAIALLTWPGLIAPVLAPVLGGFITTYFDWRWNFWLNIPIGMLGLALIARYVPDYREQAGRDMDWPGVISSAAALLALLYGLESFTHAGSAWFPALLLSALGISLGVWATRHFQRAEHPLLDLTSFKFLTYRISTLGPGAWLRIAINATPFLLPLLFQVGFGLSAFASGTLIVAYFAGNLGMKAITTATLRRFGFRSVLVVNGAIAGLAIAACALFSPQWPHWIIMAVLVVAGLTRSMQFTSLTTLTYADIDAAHRSSASTLASMQQQIMSVLGVAMATLLLHLAQFTHAAQTPTLNDFRITFAVIGLVGMVAALYFLKLPRDTGAEVSGHVARPAA